MIGLQVFRHVPTGLEINGPILKFSEDPSSTLVSSGATATFTGICSAYFPTQSPANPAVGNGTVTYQWYEVNVGALSDGTNISGTATTTLTLSNVISPDDAGRQFYLRAEYTHSAYGVGKSTGNAINEPLDSNTVSLSINPFLTIDTQPGIVTTAQGLDATFCVTATISDGTDSDILYSWTENGTTISGEQSNCVTLSNNTVGVNTIQGVITHANATNSPLYTDVTTYNVVDSRQIVSYDLTSDGGGWYGNGSQNLADGSLTLTADPNTWTRTINLYTPEEDVPVKITFAAGAGSSRNSNRGGYGGKSVFNLTLTQNTEYIVKLGALTAPSGGSNGGGGGAFFYKKGNLLVALGGGGGAGDNGRGGDGGGVAEGGENGGGRNGGNGGILYDEGALPLIGFFAGGGYNPPVNYSAVTGGRVSACTIGNYWAGQGYAPCADVGNVKFRTGDGTEVSETPTIQRGYKAGLGHRNDGGNGSGNNGGGGGGAYGGDAGNGDGAGGGGASGYSNGEATIVTTQLGGNSSNNAYITIEKQS